MGRKKKGCCLVNVHKVKVLFMLGTGKVHSETSHEGPERNRGIALLFL
jgi:hypothetical protein